MFHCITGESLPSEMQLEYQTKISGAARGQLKHKDRQEALWDTSNVVLKPQAAEPPSVNSEGDDNSDSSDTVEAEADPTVPDELDRQLLELLESTHSSLAEAVPSAAIPEASELASDEEGGAAREEAAVEPQDEPTCTVPTPLEQSSFEGGDESWIKVTAEEAEGASASTSATISTSATDPDMSLLQDALGNSA
jgi:hypothetical protein